MSVYLSNTNSALMRFLGHQDRQPLFHDKLSEGKAEHIKVPKRLYDMRNLKKLVLLWKMTFGLERSTMFPTPKTALAKGPLETFCVRILCQILDSAGHSVIQSVLLWCVEPRNVYKECVTIKRKWHLMEEVQRPCRKKFFCPTPSPFTVQCNIKKFWVE